MKIVSKESDTNAVNNEKIVELRSEEDYAKDIWHYEEVVEAPEAVDVISDTRTRPEYDVKFQQYVGTEDAFLQVYNQSNICNFLHHMFILFNDIGQWTFH